MRARERIDGSERCRWKEEEEVEEEEARERRKDKRRKEEIRVRKPTKGRALTTSHHDCDNSRRCLLTLGVRFASSLCAERPL